jgi:hypothetical protein
MERLRFLGDRTVDVHRLWLLDKGRLVFVVFQESDRLPFLLRRGRIGACDERLGADEGGRLRRPDWRGILLLRG